MTSPLCPLSRSAGLRGGDDVGGGAANSASVGLTTRELSNSNGERARGYGDTGVGHGELSTSVLRLSTILHFVMGKAMTSGLLPLRSDGSNVLEQVFGQHPRAQAVWQQHQLEQTLLQQD